MPVQDPVLREMLAEQAYGPITSAAYADAATSARANETARKLGLPADIVDHALPDMMAEERTRKRLEQARHNETYARIMSNRRLAMSAMDDDHLPTVAQRVDEHRNFIDFNKMNAGPLVGGLRAKLLAGGAVLVGRLISGTAEVARGIQGIDVAVQENLGFLGAPTFSRNRARTLGDVAKATRYETSSRNFNDIAQGVESLPGSLAALGVTVATGNPLLGVGALGGVTGGGSYLTGRDEGLNPQEAAIYGATDAAIETGTELMPERFLGRLFGAIPGGGSAVSNVAKALGLEVIGEQGAAALQGFNRWYWIDSRKGQSFSDFVATLPDQARSTLVATVTGFGLTVGAGHIVQKVYQPLADRQAAVNADRIMEAAAQSPTRTANPTDFGFALNQVLEDSGAENLYVPAEEITKLFDAEQGDPLDQMAEDQFWGKHVDQVREAAALGGDVVIPLADAATFLAGTPQWEALRDFARVSPSGASITEAKAKRPPEELQAMAERASNLLAQSMGQMQHARARQIVGNWAQPISASGEQANLVNRMLASSLAANYGRDVQRRLEAGEPAQSMEEFAAAWLPQAKRMAQADYEVEPGVTLNAGVIDEEGPQAADGDQAATLELRQPAGLRGGLGLLDVAPGTILGTDEPIEGAPARLNVPGRGPVDVVPTVAAREAAQNHMRNMGLNYSPARRYAKLDQGRAARIAAAFEALEHAPDAPEVQRAYAAMIEETLQQFQVIKETGLEIEFITGEDPYAASPRLAILDVQENNHLWVFPTEGGFGQGEVASSPMLQPVDEFIGGRQLLANDVFRIVHDYFGHIKDGHGFRAEGEENAWQSHAAMYTPLARRAMTTETRGQNSWLNFGPHADHNKNASGAETIYAPQKVGLLPEWASEEGMLADKSSGTRRLRAYHGTPFEFETFAPGKAAWFAEDRGLAERYANPRRFRKAGEGRVIEATLGISNPLDLDPALRSLPSHTVVENPVEWVREKFGFDLQSYGWERIGQDYAHAIFRSQAFADAARSAGYDALRMTEGGGVTWGMLDTENIERPGQALNQGVGSPAFQRWFGDSKVVDERGEPLIVYHGTNNDFDAFEVGREGFASYFGMPVKTARHGIFFAENEDFADHFGAARGGHKIIPVYLSIQNPFDMRDDAISQMLDTPEGKAFENATGLSLNGLYQSTQEDRWEEFDGENGADFVARLKDAGYDGAIMLEAAGTRKLEKVWVAFEPTQIKSALANRGTYDPTDSIILNQAVEVPGFAQVAPYLTAEERAKLRDDSKRKIMSLVQKLPKAEEMAAVAVAGRAKKGWYANSAQAIVDVFGIADAPRFAALLAALSPQTSVEMNTLNALRVWTGWIEAGRPTDRDSINRVIDDNIWGGKGAASVLPAWRPNSFAALSDADPATLNLSGPKVSSFMLNLMGVVDEVTNDTWMANYADVDPVMFKKTGSNKGPGYKAMNVVTRKAAEIATERTGMDWSPSEIQETVWSFARTLYLRRDVVGEDRTMLDLLEAGQITHADIADTPDFAVLFSDGIFRTILEEAGYDTTSLESGRQAAGRDGEASVADAEGTGFDDDAFRGFLAQAAQRLEQVRHRRRADRAANDAQGTLTLNQAVTPTEEAFYSAAQRAVAESRQDKATAQQWKALLTPGKTPGIKTEEIEWTGIHDWLDMQQGQIEKGALLQVLRDRGIQVEEVMLGRPIEDVMEEYADMTEESEDFEIFSSENDPKFQSWTSDPSNATYRELLITLPLGAGGNPSRAPSTHWDTEAVVAHTRFMDKTDADGKRVLFVEEIQSDWHQKGRDQGYEQAASPEQKAKIDAAALALNEADKEIAETLIAIREQDQKLNDMAAPVVSKAYDLFVDSLKDNVSALKMKPEELENLKDVMRTQMGVRFFEGRTAETGYVGWNDLRGWLGMAERQYQAAGEQWPAELDAEINEAKRLSQERSRLSNAADLKRNELAIAKGSVSGIPNAPFKSSWPALVMKRLIRYAAENGYDRVAWTTGEEQAERYNLSETLGGLDVQRDAHIGADGRYLVIIDNYRAVDTITGNYKGIHKQNANTFSMTPEQMVEVFGQDLGGRMKAAADAAPADKDFDGNEIPGIASLGAGDLRVGGEGMKAFYDRNLVNITNDIIKKYGAKVSGVTVKDMDVETTPDRPEETQRYDALHARMRELEKISGGFLRYGEEGPAKYDAALATLKERIDREAATPDSAFPEGKRPQWSSDEQAKRVEVYEKSLAARPDAMAAMEEYWKVRDEANALRQKMQDERTFTKHPGFDITDKMRDAALGGFPLFQQKRGNISIVPGPDGLMQSALIRAFEASNFSTAVHELGHFFLEDLRRRALSTGASDQERSDWETFKNWAMDQGVTVFDDASIPVDAHEYFARGFERFTWEGAAPSRGLRAVFFRMREFMLDLYKRATQFNSPITPEIREVMGRMIASDEEIEQQRADMALVSGQLDELMTEAERKAYSDLTEESRQDARDALFTKVLAGLKQERAAEAKERKEQIRQEVTAEVDDQPIFRAIKLLTVGTPIGDGQFSRVKLSRQQLIELYGADIESRMPRLVPPIIADKDTLDIDQVAALAGFESGDAMVKALQMHADVTAQMKESGDRRSVRKRLIEDQVDDRVRDEIGDPFENLEEEALAAIANERQADQLSMELRAISRKAGRKPTAWRLAKEWAEKRVRLQSSQEATSGRAIQMYARNASKAGRMAEEALIAGKFDEAFEAKQRQMLNLALMSEAKKAKDEVDRAVRRMQKLAGRATIPSMDQDYLDQAHQLLEDVELKARSQTEIDKRQAFEDWFLERVAEGIEPVVPARYRTILGQRHWSRITIDELLELDRAVGQIVELGRLKKRLRDGQEQRDFDEGIMLMVGQAETTRERSRSKTTDPERTFGGRVKSRLRGVDAAMIKVEQMTEWLDGGEPNGPWRRLLFGVMADAQVREKDMTSRYVTRLNELIQAMPKEQARSMDRAVDTPELIIRNTGHSQAGQPFRGTKDQVIMMAMNWGNEGNRQRLLDGFGWQEADMLTVFDRLLTKQDWDFVQNVWDLVDELWPEIEQMERRVNGVAPERIEATEVQTRHGMYRGGYFPVVFDPNESTRAELDEASKLSPNGAWHQVSVRSGATRARVERVMGRPLQLNMSVITRHIGEVIHDISHREAVVQVRKIISDNRIRAVVNSRLGPEYYRRMGSWMENIATPNVANSKSDPAMVGIARHLNKGVSLVGLGFRFTTVAAQLLGFSNIKSEVKRSLLLEGMRIVMNNPRTAYNEIVARSGEMRSRFMTMDASIDDMMQEAAKGKLRTIGPKGLVKYAFHGILYMDMLVTMTGWTAAYNQALKDGQADEDAVAFADSVIRKTQGAGARKDRSAIMYENDFARSFWPFFSYLNALYNQQRDVFHRARRAEDIGDVYDVVRRGWWVMIVPTLAQAMLFGEGPDDEEDDAEGWAAYLTKAALLGNFASIPGVGAIANAIGSGYGYRSNAWQGIGEDIKKGWDDTDKLLTEEGEELKGSTIQKVLSTIGILTAKPLGQIGATTRGAYDYATGEADPEGADDWYYLLTKGRIPDKPTAMQQAVEDIQANDSSVAP